jgi:hypothetical protein
MVKKQPNQFDLELASEYLAGASSCQLAVKHGIRSNRVLRGLARTGVSIRSQKADCVDVSILADEYLAGAWIVDLSRKYSVSQKIVHSRLLAFGVQLRPKEGNVGARNGSWSGGRTVDKDGYYLLSMFGHPMANNAGYVREHRFVMSRYLGRVLLPEEVVHHRDGNKANNHIDNLELYEKNSQHLAVELKGRVPKWTEAGLHNMKTQPFARQKRTLQKQLESCAAQ